MKNLNTYEDNCLPNLIQSENEFEDYKTMIDTLRTSLYKLERKYTSNIKNIADANENRLSYLLPVIIDCRSLLFSLVTQYQKSSFIDEVKYPTTTYAANVLDVLFECSFNNPHDFNMQSTLLELNRTLLILSSIGSIDELPVSSIKNIIKDITGTTARIRSMLKEKAYVLLLEDMSIKESDESYRSISGLVEDLHLLYINDTDQRDKGLKLIVSTLIGMLSSALNYTTSDSSAHILNFRSSVGLALDNDSIKTINTHEFYLNQTVTTDVDTNSLLVNLILIKRIVTTGDLDFSNAGFLIQLLFKAIEQILRLQQRMFSKDVVSLQVLNIVSNQ